MYQLHSVYMIDEGTLEKTTCVERVTANVLRKIDSMDGWVHLFSIIHNRIFKFKVTAIHKLDVLLLAFFFILTTLSFLGLSRKKKKKLKKNFIFNSLNSSLSFHEQNLSSFLLYVTKYASSIFNSIIYEIMNIATATPIKCTKEKPLHCTFDEELLSSSPIFTSYGFSGYSNS